MSNDIRKKILRGNFGVRLPEKLASEIRIFLSSTFTGMHLTLLVFSEFYDYESEAKMRNIIKNLKIILNISK